jgi:hypothetical protein
LVCGRSGSLAATDGHGFQVAYGPSGQITVKK